MTRVLPQETVDVVDYSPFFALIEGKSSQEQEQILARYDTLPDSSRDILLSAEISAAIKKLELASTLPKSHRVAVARMVGLIILGDVPSTAMETLLLRIGIPANTAPLIAASISDALKRAALEAKQKPATALTELPPLTQRVPQQVARPGTETPARNIIDLRKKPGA